MTRRTLVVAVASALGIGLGVGWWRGERTLDERAARLAFSAPHWSDERLRASVDASEAALEPVGSSINERLRAVELSEAEIVAFHDTNLDVFGGRSLAESRVSAEKLLRIHRVRRDLGLPDPDSGIRWPDEP